MAVIFKDPIVRLKIRAFQKEFKRSMMDKIDTAKNFRNAFVRAVVLTSDEKFTADPKLIKKWVDKEYE